MKSKEAGIRKVQHFRKCQLILHLFGEGIPDSPGLQANARHNIQKAVGERSPDGIIGVAIAREENARHHIVQKALEGVGHKKLDPANLVNHEVEHPVRLTPD